MGLFFAQEQTTRDWSTVIDQLARTPLSKVIIFVAVCTALRLVLAPYLTKMPEHRRGFAFNLARICNETLDAVIYAGVFVFLLIRPFCIQAFKIPSESMEITLLPGDFIVANKAIYRYADPKVGDIVVFRPPPWACEPDQIDPDGEVNVDFIKRCIGVAGDVIEVKNGTLFRNGQPQVESYINGHMDHDFKLVKYRSAPGIPDPTEATYWPLLMDSEVNSNPRETAKPFLLTNIAEEDRLRNMPAAAVPKGYYLFMGDNRNNSFDGRSWGLVPREAIVGKSEFIWLPISRWRLTPSLTH